MPRRVAMLSVHTSPLEQPGTGDAGGMNVYVVELAKGLARRGVHVEIFTRATSSERMGPQETVELADGVLVRHVLAGPLSGLGKHDLPGQLCAFTAGVMSAVATAEPEWYDIVHSHYWLSGQVGWLVADRWNVPLVHSMHTMAKVKNAALADGDSPEPAGREIGEEQVVRAADRLLANTPQEARELVELYGADPDRVAVIAPGVDLDAFSPAADRAALRARLGIEADAAMLLFAGRIQPLKAPDVLIKAAAALLRHDPGLRSKLVVVLIGGPSGSGLAHPEELSELAVRLGLMDVPGVPDVVRFQPPMSRPALAHYYRAADLVAVPSYNESFGLVAIEAQACGTPVVAAAVGGLRVAVADGSSGVLVAGHDPASWAQVIGDLLRSPERLAEMRTQARAHALGFGWDHTVDRVLTAYADARQVRLDRLTKGQESTR